MTKFKMKTKILTGNQVTMISQPLIPDDETELAVFELSFTANMDR
jgi:hypothetical protein